MAALRPELIRELLALTENIWNNAIYSHSSLVDWLFSWAFKSSLYIDIAKLYFGNVYLFVVYVEIFYIKTDDTIIY